MSEEKHYMPKHYIVCTCVCVVCPVYIQTNCLFVTLVPRNNM